MDEEMAMKIALAIKSAIASPVPPSEEVTAGFSFNLPYAQVEMDRDRRVAMPVTKRLILKLLQRAQIDDLDAATVITEKLYEQIAHGGTERDFIKWCKSPEAPRSVSGRDRRWYELMHWSGFSVSYACRDREIQSEESIQYTFPFLWIDAYACRVVAHASLDGFVALRVDPIWQKLQLPLGWLCGCSILALLDGEPEVTPDASLPGLDRLDAKLVASCIGWENRAPIEALRILSR